MNEAELLFSRILGCDRISLYLDRQRALTGRESAAISTALKRRIAGEPLDYILGTAEFMGLEFKVSPAVLIPRPETEILVETVLSYSNSGPGNNAILKILEIGTGSGCVAVSLAKLMPKAVVTAVDISREALKIAAENAKAHKVKVSFLRSDIFSGLDEKLRYDFIVFNPPYIRSEEIAQLQRELKYEPRIALDGGKDGLGFYRRIIKDAPDYLRAGGLLFLEIGFGQARRIEDIFKRSKRLEIVEVAKDYNNIDRVVVARRQTSG